MHSYVVEGACHHKLPSLYDFFCKKKIWALWELSWICTMKWPWGPLLCKDFYFCESAMELTLIHAKQWMMSKPCLFTKTLERLVDGWFGNEKEEKIVYCSRIMHYCVVKQACHHKFAISPYNLVLKIWALWEWS